MHLGNKNKLVFILYSARLFVPLHAKKKKVMKTTKNQLAAMLLNIKAVKLEPQNPFTWASGWKSPIYTDNRKTLSFPKLRSMVKLELCHAILENFPEAEAVAGVATGAIAQGALVADELELPYAYVRPKPKDHGMGNQIEGDIAKGAKVVVVEDLISTGGSSLKAVQALRDHGCEVVGMVAAFTYGFPVAEKAFAEAGVKLITLTDYNHIVEEAAKTGYIKEDEKAVLAEWRQSPETWKQ
jgi:orotate phosphoribosyltransferase